MYLLYLLIIIICICLLKSFHKERAFSKGLLKEERSLGKILMLNIGKKTSAFTIENTKQVYGVSVISINFLQRLWLGIKSLFFTDSKLNNYLKSLSARKAIVLMKQSAENAEYIVNAKIDYIQLDRGKILAHAYGTAVYLYKDTLGLFLFPEDRELLAIKRRGYNFPLRSLKTILISCSLIFLLYSAYFKYSQYLVDKISYQDETAIWHCIQDTILENRISTSGSSQEKQLQKLIDDLSAANLIPANNFNVYLLNSEDLDISVYPGGNITVTTNLLKQIPTENGLTFLLANEIGHYLKKHNIINLSTDLINIYRSLRTFGEESWVAGIFIRAGLFSDIKFTLLQEEVADNFALSVINHYYGHISGAQEVLLSLNQINTDNNKYIENHVISKERLANLDNLITKYNYTAGETKPLYQKIQYKQPQPEKELSQPEDPITSYNQDVSYLFSTYKQNLSAFSNTLVLPLNLTLEDLDQKLNVLQTALKEIDNASRKFIELSNNYDSKIKAAASKLTDIDQRGLFLINWEKIKKQTRDNMNFYFAQDRNVIETEQLILDFLKKRYGAYKVTEKGLVFDSANTLEKYNTLVARLNDYSNQKPLTK